MVQFGIIYILQESKSRDLKFDLALWQARKEEEEEEEEEALW